MRIFSLVMFPATFFLPSRSTHVTLGKLALIGMLIATFFLFTAGYVFPGGAAHYPTWAEAIVHGFKLPPGIAQREVAFPLLYILSGFTLTHSFIGITLIFALFAILMAMLVYLSLEKASPAVAFYMALACIASLSPYTYMKFFYPDEAYMFFNLLACMLLIRFIQSKGAVKFLYFFTFAAVAASFTRTAGTLMFPVFLFIGYIAVRGSWRHYVVCILLFTLAAGLYQWHRYEIFDIRHQTTKPSGKGMQTIYPVYLYSKDFGVELSPDTLGPNAKRLDAEMRAGLGSNLRTSDLLKGALFTTPSDFSEKYVYAYTPEQLIHKIWTEPNEEYYMIIINTAGDNDKLLLDTVKEIAKAHPWYMVQYTMRNLWHALFDPGYAVTRYNAQGYLHTGMEFVPASPSWGVNSADSVDEYGDRAVREMQYYPVQTKPPFIQEFFSNVKIFYMDHFHQYVFVSSIFIFFAWFSVCLALFSKVFHMANISQTVKRLGVNALVGPIVVASTFVLYEDLMTAAFCQPVYRYFHLTEPMRLVIAGFGVIFFVRLISTLKMRSVIASSVGHFISAIQKRDLIDAYFSKRRTQWLLLLVGLNIALFTWWVLCMIKHTS